MRSILAASVTTLVLLGSLPTFHAATANDINPSSTGPVLTPEGTWITPPPGAPREIMKETLAFEAPTNLSWLNSEQVIDTPSHASPTLLGSCTLYEAGWYETNSASLYGGHMGIVPQNMPPDTSQYCSGYGMGYTDGVSFGATSWIQAGAAIFPGESSAKWFCQSNDNGSKNTQYGPANTYGNGATIYTWFARDSSGVWRTYRYDSGPYSIELPCAITRGASGNLQVYGEIQGAASVLAPMGVWKMFDLRYEDTSGSWWVPTQLQASYPNNTPCPPYGAGTVSAGVILAGSTQTCATGTSAYPN